MNYSVDEQVCLYLVNVIMTWKKAVKSLLTIVLWQTSSHNSEQKLEQNRVSKWWTITGEGELFVLIVTALDLYGKHLNHGCYCQYWNLYGVFCIDTHSICHHHHHHLLQHRLKICSLFMDPLFSWSPNVFSFQRFVIQD